MEGNECYKFSTIKNYLEQTGLKKIEVILDVGVNVGDISLMMHDYFPAARIFGFEVVAEYYQMAAARLQHLPEIRLYNAALSAQHLFADDMGESARQENVPLRLLKGRPEAGPGWGGGSVVVPSDHELVTNAAPVFGFEKSSQAVTAVSLQGFLAAEGIEEVDLLKMDCEGCEHSVLGCAELATLRRIRFIVGEYHDLRRFYRVMQKKLFQTHKVNLIGQRDLGCFLAERLEGQQDGLLRFDKEGMLQPRPWLCDMPIDWHLFNERYVMPQDRHWHALSS